MPVYTTYCIYACIVSIVLNGFFLLVSHLRRVEGFQEVLIFMQNISATYILMSLCLLCVAPQSVTLGSATIRIPYGILESFEPSFLNGIASLGAGCYLYTVLCFCILFFYRYNVTCKTSTLSTIFSKKNILVFLIIAIIFCLIQSVLLYYSSVDSQYLKERLNRTVNLREDLASDLASMQTQATNAQNSQIVGGNSNNNNNRNNNGQHQSNDQQQANVYSIPTTSVQSTRRIINVFGADYQRNPMVFLSIGIFAVSVGLSFICSVIISLIVCCKLHTTENYGKESMSNKSKEEQKKLTKILMLTAYSPIFLITITAVNFVICVLRQQSLLIQEYITCIVVPIIPLTFPVFMILLVPALRVTAWQVIICKAWSQTNDSGDSDIEGNTAANTQAKNRDEGNINEQQMKALKNMARK